MVEVCRSFKDLHFHVSLSFYFSLLEFPLYAIVVIAVGGMILIFMIFMTIVMIALCINYKRKKGRVM